MNFFKLFIFTLLCCCLTAGSTGCNFPPAGPICMGSYLVGSSPEITIFPCIGYRVECRYMPDPYYNLAHLQVDLAELSECEIITGNLLISRSSLTNLADLENLTSVEGDLWIEYTRDLANLTGLENLTSVKGELKIYRTGLNDITGLNNLASVGEDLRIYGNDILPTCEAEWLRDTIGVENIGGEISIYGNCDACTCE